jgi:hypothetical protein
MIKKMRKLIRPKPVSGYYQGSPRDSDSGRGIAMPAGLTIFNFAMDRIRTETRQCLEAPVLTVSRFSQSFPFLY